MNQATPQRREIRSDFLFVRRSRYSISPGLRSVDDPVLALVFLQPTYHPRFRCTRGGRDRALGADVWVVNDQEQARPTVVRAQGNADAPSNGRLWIDAATGRVEHRIPLTIER